MMDVRTRLASYRNAISVTYHRYDTLKKRLKCLCTGHERQSVLIYRDGSTYAFSEQVVWDDETWLRMHEASWINLQRVCGHCGTDLPQYLGTFGSHGLIGLLEAFYRRLFPKPCFICRRRYGDHHDCCPF